MDKNYLPLLVLILVIVGCLWYSNRSTDYELYANPRIQDVTQSPPTGVSSIGMSGMASSTDIGPAPIAYNEGVLPYPQISNPYQQQSEFVPPLPCEGKDILNPKDLLPVQTPNSAWDLSNPQGQGSLEGKNFLESTANFGIDTVGSSLRNANYQLRSDPYIKPQECGPWNQSTITPDTSHRYFEVGSA